MSVVKFA